MSRDVLSAIQSRISAAKLAEPGPSAAQLEQLLLAAVHAPDHGRLAPWRFAILEGASRKVLGDALATVLRRKHPDATEDMLATERAKALRAPTIVAVAAHPNRAHKVPESEQVLAVAAAVQNLILAAGALGFGTMWKTGAPAYEAGVKQALGFEPDDQIVGFVYLGTTATPGQPRQRSLEGVVRRI